MKRTERSQAFEADHLSVEPPQSATSPTASATIIWLDALVRSLDLPLHERRQIRLELQSHIEDRVRDLILEGIDEGEATRRALAECGEASSLASGFSEVKKALRRRTLMNIGVVGAACGLVALGLGSFNRSVSTSMPPEELAAMQQQAQPLTSDAQAAALDAQTAALDEKTAVLNAQTAALDAQVAAADSQASAKAAGKRVSRYYNAQENYAIALPRAPLTGPSVEFNNEPMESILNAISRESGELVLINWTALSIGGVERCTQLQVKMPIGNLVAAVEFLNESIGDNPESGPGPIAIRKRPEGLEIVSTAWLDKREAKLVVYDLSQAVENGATSEELTKAITQFIEPSNWKENGGDRAELTVVGNRLLVKAPSRIHGGVQWMLDQFEEEETSIETGSFNASR